jgi:hypothetical protein
MELVEFLFNDFLRLIKYGASRISSYEYLQVLKNGAERVSSVKFFELVCSNLDEFYICNSLI